jgi:hypothetical protein
VAYTVQTAESVESYIHGIEGFSDEGKRRLIEGYLHDLAERADHFLERYRFIADGSAMPYGVVRVIYVDHETEPVPD